MPTLLALGFSHRLALSLGALALVACTSSNDTGQDDTGGNGSSDSTGSGGAGNVGGASQNSGGSSSVGDGSVGSGGTSMSDGGTPVGAPPPRPPFDWMGVVGTGQSLSVGAEGNPVTLTKQPYQNLKLALGGAMVPPYDPSAASLMMAPLVEPIRPSAPAYPGAYPLNIYGETPHTAMANQISALFAAQKGNGEYQTVHTVVGESGMGISIINKAAAQTGNMGHAYPATLFEAQAIKRLATAAGKTYGVGAIVLTHGEADCCGSGYEAAIHQLWQDYNTDLKGITGQMQSIPLILSQQQSTPSTGGSSSTSLIAEWHMGVMYHGDLICAGPKYQYNYAEGTHLIAHEYDRLGEKYGEIYYERVVLGHDWQPLEPKTVTKAGKVIIVDFNVPVGPLNWDETLRPPHQVAMTEWAKGRGFEVHNGNNRATIDSVAIDGTKVVITLSADIPATGGIVGYAATAEDIGADGGGFHGSLVPRRGQLRDSDPLVGTDAETISCKVTMGSADIQANTAGAFKLHAGRDIAEGASLAAETIVIKKMSDSAMTLSNPWTGATGTVDLKFRSDHRNYCVSFELPIP
jgi:hypothetical protein